MLRRYWHIGFAALVIIVTPLLLWLWLAPLPPSIPNIVNASQGYEKYDSAQAYECSAEYIRALHSAIKRRLHADKCEKDAADNAAANEAIAQSGRVTQATEQGVWLAYTQTRFALAQTILLAVTVILAFWAGIASHNSATSAQKTLRGQSARVFLHTKLGSNLVPYHAGSYVSYEFKNYGITPAVMRRLACSVNYFPSGFPDPDNAERRPVNPQGFAIPPNGDEGFNHEALLSTSSRPLTEVEFTNARNGIGMIYFYGFIVFEDVFDELLRTDFCWQYVPKGNKFLMTDKGNKTNYKVAKIPH